MGDPKTIAHLPCDQLRWHCSPEIFAFETTAELNCHLGVIGQETAREALRFGIECDAPGQHVYVRGSRGTGRSPLVRQLLKELAPTSESKRDYCYVHNFSRPDHPRLITLPPGQANTFRKRIGEIAEFVQNGLIKSLSGEPYNSQRAAIHEAAQKEAQAITKPLEDELKENGMALVTLQNAPRPQTLILPVVEGQPVPHDQFQNLVNSGRFLRNRLNVSRNFIPSFKNSCVKLAVQWFR